MRVHCACALRAVSTSSRYTASLAPRKQLLFTLSLSHSPSHSLISPLFLLPQGLSELAPRLTSLRLSDAQLVTDYDEVLTRLTGVQ